MFFPTFPLSRNFDFTIFKKGAFMESLKEPDLLRCREGAFRYYRLPRAEIVCECSGVSTSILEGFSSVQRRTQTEKIPFILNSESSFHFLEIITTSCQF